MQTKSKTRKIIKSGDGLLVRLPNEFVKDSGIKKGDVVGVVYDSVLMIVTPKELPKENPDALGNQ
jgi:antitoxin component of MazEF toxin-antitoxin module